MVGREERGSKWRGGGGGRRRKMQNIRNGERIKWKTKNVERKAG